MRDKELDVFRGITMLYIVGIIHGVYWLKLTSFSFKYIVLFEMPIIFFIMGASFSLCPKKLSINYIIKRLFRCLIPVVFYSLVVLILNFIYNPILLRNNWTAFIKFIFDPILRYNKIPFLNWHLWFIPIYIIFIPIIPLMYLYFYKNIKKVSYKILILLILALFLFSLDILEWNNITIKGNYYLRNMLVYGIYIYLGFEYLNQKINKKYYIINIFISIFLMLLLKKFYVFDMQINKFPPNFIFLLFTFSWFNFLILINRILLMIYKKISILRKVVDFYSEKNFILYLWHPIIYLVVFYFIKKINIEIKDLNAIIKVLIIILIVTLNMINGVLFYWTEKLVSLLSNIGNKNK